jgi:hypothetical protein
MRATFRLLLSIVLALPWAAAASAQEAGRVGITMGYPTAVGVIWHLSDAIAVRPEVNVTTSTTNTTLSTTSATAYGVGVTGLFFFKRWDAVGAYLAPRYGYQHGSATTGLGVDLPLPLPIDLSSLESGTTTSQHNFSGLVGAQFFAHRHFAVFGEVGATYSTATTRFTVPLGVPALADEPSHAFGIRSSVGAVFYF